MRRALQATEDDHEPGQFPGHAHQNPPLWDDAGSVCEQCLVWRAALSATAGRELLAELDRLKALTATMAEKIADMSAKLTRCAERQLAPDSPALLAAKAIGIMLNRGWYVVPNRWRRHGTDWVVRTQEGFDLSLKFIVQHEDRGYRADPATILIEADEWYRQNVDQSVRPMSHSGGGRGSQMP